MSYKNKDKQREYQRNYYHRRLKKTPENERPVRNDFDIYGFKIVPDSWRSKIQTTKRRPYNIQEISSPLVKELLDGKTVYVDYTVPYGRSKYIPFRTLYPYFQVRGFQLRIYTIDNPAQNDYRKLLMWCEPLEDIAC